MSDSSQTDALAAEYVLGTLDGEEIAQAQVLIGTDPEFAAKVKRWERRLGELHLMVEPVEPDPRIWEQVKSKMPTVRPIPPAVTAPPVGPPSIPASSDVMLAVPAPPAPATAMEPIAAPAETPSETSATVVPASAEMLAAPPAAVPTASAEAAVSLPAGSAADLTAAAVPPTTGEGAAAEADVSVPPPAVVVPPAGPTPEVEPPPSATTAAPPAPRRVAAVETDRTVPSLRLRLRLWRTLGLLTTLLVLAVAGLLSAWRFAPERVPPMLQPVELLREVGITLPAPPESQFDE
jgi:hypothetical protein